MKLSFSTRGWESCSWEEQLNTANEMHFDGIEMYNAHKHPELFDKSGHGAPAGIAAKKIANVRFGLGKGGNAAFLGIDLQNDVVAELRFDDIGNFADFHFENGFIKGGNHCTAAEPAKRTAVLAAGAV